MTVWTRQISRGLAAFGFSLLITPAVLAQKPETQAYLGCDDIQLATVEPSASDTPTSVDLLPQPVSVETTKTTRILQGQSAKEVAGTGDANETCWARLDGIWQDDSDVKFDTSVEVSGWAADQPKLQNLAHGNYTNPELIVVLPGDDMNTVINVIDAFDPQRRGTFVSTDGISLDDTLKIRGPRKVYTASSETELGSELLLDVDINGFVRLRLGDRIFRRPSPGLIAQTESNSFALDDVFIYSSNLDNVVASRSGYDITSADPFDLVGTGKKEVFKEVFGREYRILEKRSVPLGFDLIPATDQGMLYTRSFMRTEKQLQGSISAAFGAKGRVGPNPSGPIPGPSASAGIDVTASIAKEMRNSQSSSRAVGHSMTKKYAIVVDHPYIELSNEFRAAIEDARRFGEYDPRYYEEIINKFGTHYPYAVTYGANAELSVTLSEKETYDRLNIGASVRVEGEAEAVTAAVSGYAQVAAEAGTASTINNGDEKATFRAVGGNGSWDEKGYAAGDRAAPILLDLRPLDELLNPLNYPGQPEVYETVRAKLRLKINNYLDLRAVGLSEWPIYNTTLDGTYHSEAFPELLFEFTPTSFAKSQLAVKSVKRTDWIDYVQFTSPLSPGVDVEALEKPFELVRVESGAYEFVTSPAEYFKRYKNGDISTAELNYYTLEKRLHDNPTWITSVEGPVQLNGYSRTGEAEPVLLRRWTEVDDNTVRSKQLTGGWQTEQWPGIVILADEAEAGFTSILLATKAGAPAALQCLSDQPIEPYTPKNQHETAGISRLVFRSSGPLEGEYKLHHFQWVIGSLLYTGMTKMQGTEDLAPKKQQALQTAECLFSDQSPFGSAPILEIDTDPDALARFAPALPVLVLNGDGGLTLIFQEPDKDLSELEKTSYVMDDQNWNPVGEPVTLTPIPEAEATRLLDTYKQTIKALEEAKDALQEG